MLALDVYHFLCDVFTPLRIVWGWHIFYSFKLMRRFIFIWCHNLFCNERSITYFSSLFQNGIIFNWLQWLLKNIKTFKSWSQNYEVNDTFYKWFLLSIYITTILYCVQDLYVTLYVMDQIWHLYYQIKAGNFRIQILQMALKKD